MISAAAKWEIKIAIGKRHYQREENNQEQK